MSKLIQATEQDFRMPEYRDAKPEDYEVREDGKAVRKDRWENGIRQILGLVGMNPRNEFEVSEVVQAVEAMAKRLDKQPSENEKWFVITDGQGNFLHEDGASRVDDLADAWILKSLFEAEQAIEEWADNGDSIIPFTTRIVFEAGRETIQTKGSTVNQS